jgi:hypothetical protein
MSAIPSAGRGGVAFNVSGTSGLYATYRRFSGGTVDLTSRSGNTTTSLGSISSVGSFTSATLRVVVGSSTIEVYLNGDLMLTHTLTPAQVSTFKSNTGWGLATVNNTGTRFDNWKVLG